MVKVGFIAKPKEAKKLILIHVSWIKAWSFISCGIVWLLISCKIKLMYSVRMADSSSRLLFHSDRSLNLADRLWLHELEEALKNDKTVILNRIFVLPVGRWKGDRRLSSSICRINFEEIVISVQQNVAFVSVLTLWYLLLQTIDKMKRNAYMFGLMKYESHML